MFGVLWATLGRGPAVYAYAGLLLLAVPVAWWLLRSLRPTGAAGAPVDEATA